MTSGVAQSNEGKISPIPHESTYFDALIVDRDSTQGPKERSEEEREILTVDIPPVWMRKVMRGTDWKFVDNTVQAQVHTSVPVLILSDKQFQVYFFSEIRFKQKNGH